MSATGEDTTSSTTPSFVSALVVACITVGAFSLLWLVLHGRKNLRGVFSPRTYLAPEGKRPEPLPAGLLAFWKALFSTPDKDLIVSNGPDAYFYVRYLKVFGLQMLVPYVILTIAVCVPISVITPNEGKSGLNMLSFGNVSASDQVRHVGHFLVAVILIAWTIFLIIREYKHLVEVRQAWLTSPQHLTLARARTVAITNVPDAINNVAGIKELAGTVAHIDSTGGSGTNLLANVNPFGRQSTATEGTAVNEIDGGVRQVWLVRKCKDAEKVWGERDNECARLEAGVSKLQKLAAKNVRKHKTPAETGKLDAEKSAGDLIDKYILPKKRPSWKQGLLGLIGKKQTLETSPEYINEHNIKLDELRSDIASLPQGNTVFVRFASQHEAHTFARLAGRTGKSNQHIRGGVEIVPEDIEWGNTSMSPWQRYGRSVVSWALTIGLIIIWAIPVAFVGMVSNVDTLCSKASWLAWICTLPSPALGIIKGVLPPALLAVLFMLLPIVLRLMVKMQGEVRKTDIELKLFTRFWLFQVIHGFLIVTLSSGLISALSTISADTVTQLPTLLSTKLPDASIFFLTFILTATFTGAAKTYARLVPVIMYALRGILAGNTPRKVYAKKYKMDSFAWATTFPPTCLLICITIVYSVIQPIITALALVAMILLYLANKFILHWCADQADAAETGGLFYVRAIRTVFVSLYIEEICLIGLFFLSSDENGNRSTTGLACGAIMVAVLVLTALTQAYIDHFRFKKDFIYYVHSTETSSKSESIEPKVGAVKASPSEEYANAGPEFGNTSGFHANAFDNPALWKKQPTIWVAQDPLGLGAQQVEQIQSKGVDASLDFAAMNEKGVIEVERSAPDEAWYGGHSN